MYQTSGTNCVQVPGKENNIHQDGLDAALRLAGPTSSCGCPPACGRVNKATGTGSSSKWPDSCRPSWGSSPKLVQPYGWPSHGQGTSPARQKSLHSWQWVAPSASSLPSLGRRSIGFSRELGGHGCKIIFLTEVMSPAKISVREEVFELTRTRGALYLLAVAEVSL